MAHLEYSNNAIAKCVGKKAWGLANKYSCLYLTNQNYFSKFRYSTCVCGYCNMTKNTKQIKQIARNGPNSQGIKH